MTGKDSQFELPGELQPIEQFVDRTLRHDVDEAWTAERADRIFTASGARLARKRATPELHLVGDQEAASGAVRIPDRIPFLRPALAVAAVVLLGVSIALVVMLQPNPTAPTDNDNMAMVDALELSEFLAGNDLTTGTFDPAFDAQLDALSDDLDELESDFISRSIEEASIYMATSEFDDWMDQFEENLDTF